MMENSQDTTSVNPNSNMRYSDSSKLGVKGIIIALLSRVYVFFGGGSSLEVRKKIYGVIIFAIILSIMIIIFFHAYIDSRMIIICKEVILLISLILGILFLMNENKLVINKFISTGIQPGIAPGSKYGLLLYLCAMVMYLSFIFMDNPGSDVGEILISILQFIIFLGTVYIYDGSRKSKMTFTKNGNLFPKRIFSEGGSIIGNIILFLLIGGLLFGLLFMMSLGSIGHGRFLFFGFNRKPRKAIIKKGNSWLIKN